MSGCKEESPPLAVHLEPSGFLLIAAWFGLLTGLAEVFLLAFQKFLLHQYIYLSPHVVWMAPLADLLIFSIPGLILFFVGWAWPRIVSLRTVAFIFAFLGFLSLLFMWSQLHHYAALLLAAGLAVQTARLFVVHAQEFHTLIHGTTAWTMAFVTVLAITVFGWQGLAEHRALAQLPPAPSSAPNVLLIVLDTVRAQSLSLYGHPRPTTPYLQQLAEIGVRFEQAVSTAPWTTPSHASMFTGRFPHELSADWELPLDSTYPTLAEVLSKHGYLTAGFVGNIEFCGRETGLNRGFAHYQVYPVSPWEIILSSSLGRTIINHHRLRWIVGYYDILGRKTAAAINEKFLRWLSYNNQQRPFFAFLNYYDAHEPYLPPEPFDVKFESTKTRRKNFLIRHGVHGAIRSEKENMSLPEIQAELDAYEGSIAYLDHHLGLLFDKLEEQGVLENTLVIITSDHGEQFGEHGLFIHGNSLYLPALHVPLLISFPARVPAGKSVREPVSLRDLPATVVDLLKLEDTVHFPGASLARYWNFTGPSSNRVEIEPLLSEVNFAPRQPTWYPIYKGDMKSLVFDGKHYIRNGDGSEELYDMENDPMEKHNLAHFEEGHQILELVRRDLAMILQRFGIYLTSHDNNDNGSAFKK